MIKKITPYGIILFIVACSAPKLHIPGSYENRVMFSGQEEAAATQYSIKNAGKLAEEHPKEIMIYDEIKMTINFDLNDKYESMREDNRDTFDDLIGNQMYQYRNMIYFTAKTRNGIDICRGLIQSDGSHDVHRVSLFSEKEFLRPFTMDLR